MFRKYSFWFSLLVLLYSVYDYLEHILRPGSTFEKHPWDWLWFTLSAIAFLLGTVLGLKYLLERVSGKRTVLFEIISIGVWLFLYINIMGPLIDKLLWPYDNLMFRFQFSAFFIILAVYFGFRVLQLILLNKVKIRRHLNDDPDRS